MMEIKYPFKFLEAYDQNDTDIFFGRDEEVKALYEMVFQNTILLVHGASGTGKTSLIQCGLAGKFKSYDWLSLTIRRGSNINQSLEKALIDAGGNDENDDDETEVEKENKLTGFHKLVRGIYLKHFKPIYLIFDQFEELYILGTKDEEMQFIDAVKEILAAKQPVKLIFCIREEYLGYLDRFEKAVPQLTRKKLRVESMSSDGLTDVLTGINNSKISNVHIKIDEIEKISDEIFYKLKGDSKTLTIELPYLQVFLDKLYFEITNDKTHQAKALITKEAVDKIKNIGDVLADFLEEEVASISRGVSTESKPVSTDTIWQILSPFATLEGTKEPTKKAEYQTRVKNFDITPELVDKCINRFTERRILNYSETTERYELVHDSLAKHIAGKRSNEDIKLLEKGRMINHQMAIKSGERELFTSKQLNIITPYLDKLNLSAEENKLINESISARKKRKLIAYSIIVVSLILSAGVALWLNRYYQRKEDNNIRIAGLTKYKKLIQKANGDENNLLAFLYTTEALALEKDSVKYDSLVRTAKADNNKLFPVYVLQNCLLDTFQIIYAAFSPGAKTVYSWTDNNILSEWDLETENKLRTAKFKCDTLMSTNDSTFTSYRFPIFSEHNKTSTTLKDTLIIQDRINYFIKEYFDSVRIEKDETGLPNLPKTTLKIYGAFFSDDNTKVITWGRNTQSMYECVDIWDHDAITQGPSLIHDGIKGASISNDNKMILSWGTDSTIRVWKYKNESDIYNLPPALIKLKARLETGVEISPADNSIKLIETRNFPKLKEEYQTLLNQYKERKK